MISLLLTQNSSLVGNIQATSRATSMTRMVLAMKCMITAILCLLLSTTEMASAYTKVSFAILKPPLLSVPVSVDSLSPQSKFDTIRSMAFRDKPVDIDRTMLANEKDHSAKLMEGFIRIRKACSRMLLGVVASLIALTVKVGSAYANEGTTCRNHLYL